MFGLFKTPKCVKLRSLDNEQKYGIAATSMKELLKKGCKIFQLCPAGCRVCLYEDGTELTEDYFRNLHDNTQLILLTKEQAWSGCICDISLLLGSSNKQTTDHLIESAKSLLSDENAPKRRKILQELIHNLSDNAEAEDRECDKDWFKGIDSRFKTKSDYMKYNCASRMRGYLKEVKDYTGINPKVQGEYQRIVATMVEQLKTVKYNGCYFDRREKEDSLCTQEGWFSCQSAFDAEKCLSFHSINPYGNRESRILFSTWNLDHRIEKKRAIIPTLAKAVENRNGREINWEYFYSLLFTRENLKLVHIACHDKTCHNLECDGREVYTKGKRRRL
ncbi:DNA fragmentation factor subunit beta [Acipenser oxyrinchus oxyrinchus]|uniref:DNA fragmentation factor subunit beta n=1 Tax=Acipenser oxyrinchus oxyrinchus TaxID=40147 RepID=A0AAD8FZH4_ACIOX|nr:DNA fragmentation factor subunit beta [Acipenser oxyrinchus oxyrinchus]